MKYKADLNRFDLGSSRAFQCLPNFVLRKLMFSSKEELYVFKDFSISAMWPDVICKNCCNKVERKISSLYCSDSCCQKIIKVKDIVRTTEEILS